MSTENVQGCQIPKIHKNKSIAMKKGKKFDPKLKQNF